MIDKLIKNFLIKSKKRKIGFSMKEIKDNFIIDAVSFESYLKYKQYKDGFFWSEDRVFFMLEILGGIYYYAPPEDLLNYYSKLKTFLRSIPKESEAMIQSIFLPYRSILFEPPKPKTDNDIVKAAYMSIVEKIKRGVKEGYFDSDSMLREIKNFLIVSIPLKKDSIMTKIEKKLDRTQRLGQTFEEQLYIWKESILTALRSLGVKYRELDAEDFLYIMFTILNQEFDPIKVPYYNNIELRRQVMYNIVTVDHHEIAYTNKRWAVAYLDYIGAVSPGFLTELLKLKRPFLVSMTLRPISVLAMKTKLAIKKRSTFSREFSRKIDEVSNQLDYIVPYEGSITLALLVRDYKDIEIVKSELSDFISEYQWEIHFEDIIAPDTFISALPGHHNQLIERTLNLYEDHALCFLNFRNFRQKFSDKGIILVGEDLTPRCINVFDSTSYGTMISGGSGSGKTFFSQYLILSCLAMGERVFVIDPLGNLEPLATLLEGSYYKIGLSEDSRGINIFPKITYEEFIKNRDLISQVLETIIKMVTLGSNQKTLTATQRSILQKAIFHMYENTPEPSISTFHDVLEAFYEETKDPDIREFSAALSLFLPNGIYGPLISNKELDMSNQLIVFDLNSIKENSELTQLVIYGIMTLISEIILKQPGKKHVLIDEAHYLITNEDSVSFIRSGVRVWRTFGGALYIVTQQLTDLLENEKVGDGIFKTVNNFFLFKQSAASFIDARPYVGYNEAELRALTELRTEVGKYAFMAYYTRSMRDGFPAFGRFYLSLPKFLYWTLTTDTEEKEKRNFLIKKYMSKGYDKKSATIKAIEELSGEKCPIKINPKKENKNNNELIIDLS